MFHLDQLNPPNSKDKRGFETVVQSFPRYKTRTRLGIIFSTLNKNIFKTADGNLLSTSVR